MSISPKAWQDGPNLAQLLVDKGILSEEDFTSPSSTPLSADALVDLETRMGAYADQTAVGAVSGTEDANFATVRIDTPLGEGTAVRVETTSPFGTFERFTVENNQDTQEVDVDFRNCTVNIGDPQAEVSESASMIFMQPDGIDQNPIQVCKPGDGPSGDKVLYIGPNGALNLAVGGQSSVAVRILANGEANWRFQIDEFGQITRGPGGANAATTKILHGTGSPEGVQTAGIGSIYQRRDGGAGTSFYVKESGAGNTGWVAK